MRTSIKAMLASTVLAASAFAAATPAFADDTAPPSDFTITGSATIASQYRFRGVAQSDNKPVVQGAITLAHSSGFYVSTWGSSAEGGAPIDLNGTEIDVYGGYTKSFSGITLDGGLYGYIYPGATGLNYYEIYGSVAGAVGPVTAKVGINFAPNQKNTVKDNTYVYGELSGSIPNTPLFLHAHLGHTGGAFNYPKQYWDFSAGATVKWKNLALDASVVGTDMKSSDFIDKGYAATVAGAKPFRRMTKPVGVVSLTASF